LRARATALAFCLSLLLPVHAAAPDEDIVVHVRKDGPVITVEVQCPVDAPPSIVWDVFTDYDHMAEFVSNLEWSRVEQRADNVLRVHQKGHASRGPISISFDTVREIQLMPFSEIRSRLLSGDLAASTFATRIVDGASGLRVEHAGSYIPNMWVPPIIGPALIEAETRKQFGEFRKEILRRAAAAAR
jgi:hypothetical protein